uniref:Uncharacterized protein n=1 Tax=Anguilla anguilla TaxID=7936 RepID=A0A0E9PQA1_ANGAN
MMEKSSTRAKKYLTLNSKRLKPLKK